jgi:hypothetical protein
VPFIPYEDRAEKALDGICKCCIGKANTVDEEDARLLTIMLQGVFPGADKEEIARIVSDKLARIKDGSDPCLENAKKGSSDPDDSSGKEVDSSPNEVLEEEEEEEEENVVKSS